MRRPLIAALGTVALVAALLLPAMAEANAPSRFQRLGGGSIDSKFTPSMLRTKESVRVVLELAARPVALHQAAAGYKLTLAQKGAIRGRLSAAQNALHGRITLAGGRLLGQYQDAYNGIKVQIRADRIARLSRLPGVIAVHAVHVYTLDNTVGVPYIGAPQAWNDYHFTGTGVKIGIIDTGIDYYHANFGGSGNPADFAADDGLTIGTPAFPNAKVAGGTDLVGDAYTAGQIPQPDPDPLDCAGHGSHVAGTAAGYGVLSDGSTFTGTYDANTISTHTWNIGPGVAPQAKIYAYRVFGCSGSTDVVIDAINDAVADGMDVINMSLGSPFGNADDPDSVASNNASLAGTMVVASAGNSGPHAMITGSPAAADRALSVAALDASVVAEGQIDIDGGLAGEFDPALSSTLPVTGIVHALLTGPSTLSLGCAASDFSTVVPGEIVVVSRGVCSFAVKGTNAQNAGAAALIVVNNLPTGTFIPGGVGTLAIPVFIFAQADGPALIGANGTSHTITLIFAPSPFHGQIASFSSGGPRDYDNSLKPEISAPGVNIVSTAVGTGTGAETLSGTSMASPHTAGAAALVTQAHPTWTPEQIKAALINTANATASNPGGVSPYDLRLAGSGVVNVRAAVDTVGFATTTGGTDTLSFGYGPRNGAYGEARPVTLWNTSGSSITYNLAGSFNSTISGASITVSPSSVAVPAHSSRTVNAKLAISNAGMSATVAAGSTGGIGGSIQTVSGAVTATPTVAGVGRYPLRVPFLVTPRGLSNVAAGSKSAYTLASGTASATVPLSNSGIRAGSADVYSWGISDGNSGFQTDDIRAVGVQVIPSGSNPYVVFAVNTWGRWGSPSDNEFDIEIDTNHDGNVDYVVFGYDYGAITTGSSDGTYAAFTYNLNTGTIVAFAATAPTNGSVVELPTRASYLGLGAGHSSFDYFVGGFSRSGENDFPAGVGHFDALAPALSQGDFLTLGRGAHPTLNVSVNEARFATTPALGWMIVTLDDANGAAQSDNVPVGVLP
jgi:minor extracellular serine protease Vpr